MIENGKEPGHGHPLRTWPKEGQLKIKITCQTPEKEYSVSTLPYVPYQLTANHLKRPGKPPKALRQKERTPKNLDGFYHVDRERGPTDNIILFFKNGAIKGVRFFIPDDQMPQPYREYWHRKHPNRMLRRIRFASKTDTLIFDGGDSPSVIQTEINREDIKIQVPKRQSTRGKKQDNPKQEAVDIETITQDSGRGGNCLTPVKNRLGKLKSVLRSPSSDFKIMPFDPKNKTYQSIIQKNTERNSVAPTVQIGGEELTLDQLSVFQMKEELTKRGEAATGVRSNLAHRLKLCLIHETPCPESNEAVLTIDTVPKDLIVTDIGGTISGECGSTESSESDSTYKKKPRSKKEIPDKRKGKRAKKNKKTVNDTKKDIGENAMQTIDVDDTHDIETKKRARPIIHLHGGRHTKKRKIAAEKEQRISLKDAVDNTSTTESMGEIAGKAAVSGSTEETAQPPSEEPQVNVVALIQTVQNSLRELTEKNAAAEALNEILTKSFIELKNKTEFLQTQHEIREKQNNRLETRIEAISVDRKSVV